MSAIALQWALNETAGNVFSVAKGFIRAASCDNVQALALLVCEAFGNTLAMCPETCLKVERIAGMHHQSVVVKFLKAQVGYSSGDSGAQLSLSSAGVRFLGLAAALNTLGPFNGALALEALIANSARSQQLLPTVTQLKDLLNVLDYKLNRAGFAEHLAGWSIWFISNPLFSNAQKDALRTLTAPSAAEMIELVKAVGELGRLGDAIQVTVTVSVTAPWVTTFIKWSLGMPPSIFLTDGTCLLEQPGSTISLVVHLERSEGMMITISRQIDKPAEIIESQFGNDNWAGMVSVHTYAQHKFQQLNISTDLARRAVLQALPYAVKRASCALQPDDVGENEDPKKMPEWKIVRSKLHLYDSALRRNLSKELAELAGNMFPKESVLSSVLSEYTGCKISTPLPDLPKGTRISDLPLVALYQQELTSECRCRACDAMFGNAHNSCLKARVLSDISSLVADILGISLLDCVMPVLLYIGNPYRRSPHQFEIAVHSALTRSEHVACSVEGVIDWVLRMVGHDVSPFEKQNWIMSSYRGQTFYPRIFETPMFLERQGLLVMSGAPGALRYDGQVYNKGVSREMESVSGYGYPPEIMSKLLERKVGVPLSIFQDLSIKWQISKGDGLLYISLLSTYSRVTFNPFPIICGAIQSLYVEDCHHGRDAALKSDEFATYASPFSPWGEAMRVPSEVSVVPAYGNVVVIMLCLVHGIPGVVQENSCLQCSFDICRRAGYRFVIDGRQSELSG